MSATLSESNRRHFGAHEEHRVVLTECCVVLLSSVCCYDDVVVVIRSGVGDLGRERERERAMGMSPKGDTLLEAARHFLIAHSSVALIITTFCSVHSKIILYYSISIHHSPTD